MEYADFYGLAPSDNTAMVASGEDVDFPQDGPNSGSAIIRTGTDSFRLSDIGTYLVLFQVSVEEGAQLVLTLNGTELGSTVAGRASCSSQITGMTIVRTTCPNSILTVRNPSCNRTLTVTKNAGGMRAVSAHLVILQIQ